MERIGVRQLRNESATWIKRANAGQTIVITVDGEPRAQLGPLEHMNESLESLVARGLVKASRAAAGTASPPLTLPTWAGTRLDKILREVRGR